MSARRAMVDPRRAKQLARRRAPRWLDLQRGRSDRQPLYRGQSDRQPLYRGRLPWQSVGSPVVMIRGAEGVGAARGGKPGGTRGAGSGTGMGAMWGSNPEGTIEAG
jgi:hypothetical protein